MSNQPTTAQNHGGFVNDIVADCIGTVLVIPLLWSIYGVATHYGATFPGTITGAVSFTSVLTALVAVLEFNPGIAYRGTYSRMDFVGDIYGSFTERLPLALGVLCVMAGIFTAVS